MATSANEHSTINSEENEPKAISCLINLALGWFIQDEGDEDETYSDGSHSEVNSDDSDEWETASEESNGNDANNQSNLQDESPGQLFIGLPPSEPRSPEIENVDIEALNNANNIPQGNVGDETGEGTCTIPASRAGLSLWWTLGHSFWWGPLNPCVKLTLYHHICS